MATKINFTKSKIQSLPIPEKGKRLYYRDSKTPGLILQITASDTKSFQVYKWTGDKPIRVTLGRFPSMTIEQARKQTAKKLAVLVDGVNPNIQKKAEKLESITLQKVFDDYLATRKALKPLTVQDYKKVMRETFSDWVHTPMKEINRDMVVSRHRSRGKSSEARANNAMRVLRALFNFAMQNYDNELGQPLFTANPVDRISHTRGWFNVERRRNVIQADQLARWYNATQNLINTTARDYLLLLLFTGLRREEGAQLKWADINFELKTLVIKDTKNHEPHCLPLTDFLVELLSKRIRESVFVFPSEYSKGGYIVNIYKPVEQVIKTSGVEFTPHDLRRSFVTIAESLDISTFAVKRLVNHKMKHDVTAGYIIHNVERLRKPMQQITDYILRAAAVKKTADIFQIGRNRKENT